MFLVRQHKMQILFACEDFETARTRAERFATSLNARVTVDSLTVGDLGWDLEEVDSFPHTAID